MTKKEREILVKIYDALSVPLPSTAGRTTQTMASYTEFVEKMRVLLPSVKEILLQMLGGETYPGALEEALEELDDNVKTE